MEKAKLPYGLWDSQVSPAMIGGGIRINDVQFSPDGKTLVWSQSQDGKTTLFAKQGDDAPWDLSGEFNPSGAVGYGGGDFVAVNEGVYFADRDGRLYFKSFGAGLPVPITPQFGGCAAPVPLPAKDFVVYVHTYEGKDVLAGVDSQGREWPLILAQGADFYLHPAIHPDGKLLAWVEWDHPNMPWDGARLMLMSLMAEDQDYFQAKQTAGDESQAVFQPIFSPDGNKLAWLQNTGEFDDLIVMDLSSGEQTTLLEDRNLLPPAWVQGGRVLAWSADSSEIFFFENEFGTVSLNKVNVFSKQEEKIDTQPYTLLEQLSLSPQGQIAMIAQSPALAPRIIVKSGAETKVVMRSQADTLGQAEFARPERVSWASSDGVQVHGLYYPPTNTRFTNDSAPPMVTAIHGGPTSQVYNAFNMDGAFFTSRGYAYFAVNYRGSTGYGRSYRDALKGNWGNLDLQDAIEGCQAMVDRGLADPGKLIIKGGSAGGYTVLNALVHHPGFFKAGICSYGVSNLFLLDMDTHKFEAHYTKSLVGTLPEAAEKFQDWSPVFHAEKIRDAMAVFQGAEDGVVPPEQSEAIVRQLRANRVPHIYKLYEGEGHGFRKKENLIDFYETIDQFLKQYVIFSA